MIRWKGVRARNHLCDADPSWSTPSTPLRGRTSRLGVFALGTGCPSTDQWPVARMETTPTVLGAMLRVGPGARRLPRRPPRQAAPRAGPDLEVHQGLPCQGEPGRSKKFERDVRRVGNVVVRHIPKDGKRQRNPLGLLRGLVAAGPGDVTALLDQYVGLSEGGRGTSTGS